MSLIKQLDPKFFLGWQGLAEQSPFPMYLKEIKYRYNHKSDNVFKIIYNAIP